MTQKLQKLTILVLLLALSAGSAGAGKLEDDLSRLWQGAWVVTTAETRSDCLELYTNNDVNGSLVRGDGAVRLDSGELGQVHKVDVKRAGVDVLIDYHEPLLIPFEDGPFQLLREARCRVELQIDVPRPVIKSRDVGPVEALMKQVVERFERRDDAMDSAAWNERRVAPFPPDYDETLAAYEEWKEAQLDGEVHDRLHQLMTDAERITSAHRSSPSYGQGLGAGMKAYYSRTYNSDCWQMTRESFYPSSGSAPSDEEVDSGEWQRGYKDGQSLAFAVDLSRRLTSCLR